MIVVSNRILAAEAEAAGGAERLYDRIGLVERHPGFVRLEVLRPAPGVLRGQETEGVDDYLVLTYWARAEDFVAWARSDDFQRAHGRRAANDPSAGLAAFAVHELVQTTERAGAPGRP